MDVKSGQETEHMQEMNFLSQGGVFTQTCFLKFWILHVRF